MQLSLGHYLRGLRASRRLDQRTLASRLGIGASYLSRLEHGEKPYLSQALLERLTVTLALTESERRRLISLRDVAMGRIPIARDMSYEAADLIQLMADVAPRMNPAQLDAMREAVQCMLRFVQINEEGRAMTTSE